MSVIRIMLILYRSFHLSLCHRSLTTRTTPSPVSMMTVTQTTTRAACRETMERARKTKRQYLLARLRPMTWSGTIPTWASEPSSVARKNNHWRESWGSEQLWWSNRTWSALALRLKTSPDETGWTEEDWKQNTDRRTGVLLKKRKNTKSERKGQKYNGKHLFSTEPKFTRGHYWAGNLWFARFVGKEKFWWV